MRRNKQQRIANSQDKKGNPISLFLLNEADETLSLIAGSEEGIRDLSDIKAVTEEKKICGIILPLRPVEEPFVYGKIETYGFAPVPSIPATTSEEAPCQSES